MTTGGPEESLLAGLARCGVCNQLIRQGGGAGGPVYQCPATDHIVDRLASPVDEWIGAIVVARLSRPDAAELLSRHNTTDTTDVAAAWDSMPIANQRTIIDALMTVRLQVADDSTRIDPQTVDITWRT